MIAVPALLLLLLGFVLFSVTIVVTDVYPSIVGLLLLGFVGAILGVFGATNVVFNGDSPDVFIAGMQTLEAIFLLTVWHRLREKADAIDHADATPDAT